MNCPKCTAEMVLRFYNTPEEAMKDVLRYLPAEMMGKPLWLCRKCLTVVEGF
ncbi:MAG TPA: hypothetical protein VMB46_06130 [Methanomassiliicoccales archaeon]|nr:hypothetical protein [Methanomassiliicoccales archaeon]